MRSLQPLRGEGPTRKRRTVPLAFQVATDPASVSVLLPRVEIVLIDGPGNREPDRPMRLRDSVAPSHHVGTVINRQRIRPRSNTIETNVVDSPEANIATMESTYSCRSLPGEVDLKIRKGSDGIGSRKGVPGGVRNSKDIPDVISRSEDLRVGEHQPVDPRQASNRFRLSGRLNGCGRSQQQLYPETARHWEEADHSQVEAPLPTRIDIDVGKSVLLQSRRHKRVRLRLYVGLRQKVARDCLLAKAAPTKVRSIGDSGRLGDGVTVSANDKGGQVQEDFD